MPCHACSRSQFLGIIHRAYEQYQGGETEEGTELRERTGYKNRHDQHAEEYAQPTYQGSRSYMGLATARNIDQANSNGNGTQAIQCNAC